MDKYQKEWNTISCFKKSKIGLCQFTYNWFIIYEEVLKLPCVTDKGIKDREIVGRGENYRNFNVIFFYIIKYPLSKIISKLHYY